MPRKPANELKNIKKNTESASTENSSKKKIVEKDSSDKKATKSTKKTASTTAKKTTSKKSTTKSTKAAENKTTTKKKSTAKKGTSSKVEKSSTKRVTTARSKKAVKELLPSDITSTTDLTKKIEILEYYDLPYRYNQTVVKVLAQTPTTLFIYWDISDVDRSNFVKEYGENFFNYTKPVLVIHNDTMNYSFEVEIDDFANSWYLHVNDSNCSYRVELGRRAKYYNEEKHISLPDNYLYVTSSNVMDAPNDCVLFDRNLKTVYFKDVKTNIITAKDITSISFLRNMGRIYDLYDLQSNFNKNSLVNSKNCRLDLNNPSSSSSTFK